MTVEETKRFSLEVQLKEVEIKILEQQVELLKAQVEYTKAQTESIGYNDLDRYGRGSISTDSRRHPHI